MKEKENKKGIEKGIKKLKMPKPKPKTERKTQKRPGPEPAKQERQVALHSRKPDIRYEFNSVKTRLYETGYSKNTSVKNTAANQEEVYNPALDKKSVDELIRKTKLNNDYKTGNHINPFLQEKFDLWKMLHGVDVQIKYVLESYACNILLK